VSEPIADDINGFGRYVRFFLSSNKILHESEYNSIYVKVVNVIATDRVFVLYKHVGVYR